MPELWPRVNVKLTDDVAVPYEDSVERFLTDPANPFDPWQALVASFPWLTLNRAITSAAPADVQAWLDQNAAVSGEPSHNLLAHFTVPVPADVDAGVIAAALNALPFVEFAEAPMEATLASVSFADDVLVVGQGYCAPADVGVDAFHVWNLPFTDGSQVTYVSVEFGWHVMHEDLVDTNGVNRIPIMMTGSFGSMSSDPFEVEHGTNVLGVVMATDNALGIVGLAPRVNAFVAPISGPAGVSTMEDTLVAIGANPSVGPGTIVHLAMQAGTFPSEATGLVLLAINELTKKGVTVIEAAGNGVANNLDLFLHPFFGRLWDRNDVDFFDSGAVMVGAATSTVPHTRINSCQGNRIDCFAWGQNVLTTSTHTPFDPSSPYVIDFNSTSAASSIVAGCAIVLQNLHRSVQGTFLSPRDLRDLLRDETLNTKPAAADFRRIGVMPNLANLEPRVRVI